MSNIIRQILNENKFEIDDAYVTFHGINQLEFENLFPIAEYPSRDYNAQSCRGSLSLDEIDFIFSDYHELFTRIESGNIEAIYEEVYIDHHGIVKMSNLPNFYVRWLELLALLADHNYQQDKMSNAQTFIFVENTERSTSTVIEVDLSKVSEGALSALSSAIGDPTLLLESCRQEDTHQNERLSVMKSTIIRCFESNDKCFTELFANSDSILNSFHRNYETYIRSFSFEEFIKDLEDDVGDFIKKVEEQIQNFYVQSLAVPGAVILSSALRGAEKSISLALIFSTFLALVLVFKALKSKMKFIDRITENTLTKLNLYQKRTEDIRNSFAQTTISEKIKDAENSVNTTSKESKDDICNLRDIIIFLIAMYLVCAAIFFRL
ncbi:hypothetical protein N7931_01515 [Catenovulum sp. 2E275]|uniref:hypothetical protein n=1 Tax=Catenovulum sp. 2E275 TaxID=2980497 RepID=UPI0021CE485B|nr:hypothetical protein [Catenovulum sp. 2E275]MCU4674297.1 hypothetical protein [Catenovulum sp. 2E275]